MTIIRDFSDRDLKSAERALELKVAELVEEKTRGERDNKYPLERGKYVLIGIEGGKEGPFGMIYVGKRNDGAEVFIQPLINWANPNGGRVFMETTATAGMEYSPSRSGGKIILHRDGIAERFITEGNPRLAEYQELARRARE